MQGRSYREHIEYPVRIIINHDLIDDHIIPYGLNIDAVAVARKVYFQVSHRLPTLGIGNSLSRFRVCRAGKIIDISIHIDIEPPVARCRNDRNPDDCVGFPLRIEREREAFTLWNGNGFHAVS